MNFVNTILSVGHYNYADPDDFSIGVQGWSTLAYGGKGLSYFTFYTIPMGNWREAPHDAYGFKSPTWRYVAHMNYAIHNISHIYKNLKSVNVFHIGNIPKGCKDISSAKVIKELKLKSLGGKVNACVGEFIDKNTGKEYIIIVNKNSKYSINIDSLIFNHGNILKSVNERSNDTDFKLFGGEGANIAPGHGLLLYAD